MGPLHASLCFEIGRNALAQEESLCLVADCLVSLASVANIHQMIEHKSILDLCIIESGTNIKSNKGQKRMKTHTKNRDKGKLRRSSGLLAWMGRGLGLVY